MTTHDSFWQQDGHTGEPQGQPVDLPSEGKHDMEQQPSYTVVTILHELDLGQHTLFLMNDGSIDVLANDESTPYLADNGIRLDGNEAYRLFIALQEQYKQYPNSPP